MGPAGCPVAVVWDDRFRGYDFGPGHPFTESSRWLAVRLLEESGFFGPGTGAAPPVRIDSADPATDEELLRFHQREYVAMVRSVSGSDRPGFLDRGDTPGFPGCHDAAARIARGTLLGLERVLAAQTTHACCPAGGLHHAHPGRASGFCIYDDVALAIATALEGPARLRRVAYIDIDAHHGDGVMYGFYHDGRVLDIDFHQDGRTLFPGTGFPSETGAGDGRGLKVNVPLPPAAGDEAVIPLFDRLVPPLLSAFRPELIVLQTGVDGHAGDPLARLQYTPAAYEHVVGTLHRIAHESGGVRLLVTGGGGYRAAHVARVLARAASRLAGGALGRDPDAPTPSIWQRAFESTLGEPAPRRWGGGWTVAPSDWRPEHGEKLLAALSQNLGVWL